MFVLSKMLVRKNPQPRHLWCMFLSCKMYVLTPGMALNPLILFAASQKMGAKCHFPLPLTIPK